MADQAAALRSKAEACRRLADMADDPLQKSLWGERADNWDVLAKQAEQAARRKPRGSQ